MWILFALLSAFTESIKDIAGKRALSQLDVQAVALANPLFALPVLAIYCSGIEPHAFGAGSLLLLFATSLLHVVALSIYFEAIRVSPLSVTLPMIAFTPLFMLLTSPLIAGEVGNLWGGIGVVLIVVGTYLLNLKARSDGLLGPYRALLRERGARLMLGVAAIWSVTGNLDRVALRSVPKQLWVLCLCSLISLELALVLRAKGGLRGVFTRKFLTYGCLVGTFNGLALITYFEALSLTMVGYVVAVKRTSILMGVVMGYFIYREESIRDRFVGAAVMLLGVAFLSIGG